jgi:hypothetical protein
MGQKRALWEKNRRESAVKGLIIKGEVLAPFLITGVKSQTFFLLL